MVRAQLTAAFFIALLGVGCGGADTGGPDASGPGGDTGVDPADADQNSPALEFEFVSRPEDVPGTVDGAFSIEVESAVFHLEDVRAIGDAAPGDERTTASSFEIRFDAEAPDNKLLFSAAPPGIYSHLLAEVRAYQIRGTVMIDSTEVSFDIDDSPGSMSIAVVLDGVRVANKLETAKIKVHLDDLVRAVPWGDFDSGSDIEIEDDDSEIDAIRDAVLNVVFLMD